MTKYQKYRSKIIWIVCAALCMSMYCGFAAQSRTTESVSSANAERGRQYRNEMLDMFGGFGDYDWSKKTLIFEDASPSMNLKENMDFLLTPGLLVQEALSDNVIPTYPTE